MSADRHVIRLRGPWKYELLPLSDSALPAASNPGPPIPSTGELNFPADQRQLRQLGWAGPVCYRRRFNLPTGLTAEVEVWLVVTVPQPAPQTAAQCAGTVFLNGVPLGSPSADLANWEFLVTQLLANHNELAIEVTPPGEFLGEVCLEIRPARPLAQDSTSHN